MDLDRRHRFVVVVMAATLLAGASALFAQEAKSASPSPAKQSKPANEIEAAVIPVQNADVDEIVMVLHSFGSTFGGSISVSDKLRTISVCGDKVFVDACKEAVRRLDVPPSPARSVELTFTVLVASKMGSDHQDVPVELQGVVEQLRKLAAFKYVRVADTQVVQVRDGGSVGVSGTLYPMEQGVAQIAYSINTKSASRLASEKEARIRLAQLVMQASVHIEREKSSSAFSRVLSSDVEFSEGQKAVIGTMGITEIDSLILVVQARDVE